MNHLIKLISIKKIYLFSIYINLSRIFYTLKKKLFKYIKILKRTSPIILGYTLFIIPNNFLEKLFGILERFILVRQ